MASDWFERDLVGDTSGHDAGTLFRFASAARAVAGRPVSWVAIVGGITGALVWSPDALLVVPLAFLVAFAQVFLDGRTWAAAISRARRRPVRLPSPLSFSNTDVRRLVERLVRAREAVRDTVVASPRGAAFDVSGALAVVPELERDVLVLGTRIEYLARFLSSAPSDPLKSELLRLEGVAAAAKHREAPDLGKIQRRIAGCRAHLDRLTSLERQRASLLENAHQILETLEQLPVAITSLQLDRLVACDAHSIDERPRTAALIENLEALASETNGSRSLEDGVNRATRGP
jgi:hypothetical protein